MLYDSHDITSHKHCHEKHDHCLEVGLCDDQLPVISSAGVGPQGDSVKVILHEDGQQISYQDTVLGADGVWREETVTDNVILTQYVETKKVSGRTKEETTLQLSDNINGGVLYHTYNYRPYTNPPSFTLTFWYLRNDTHETTADGAHSYVAWRFTTRPIPYLPDFENNAGAATVGTGVGALYIRGSVEDEWISKLIYPDGVGPAEGTIWPTGGPIDPNMANAPAPKALWSVNLTLGIGGDIDIPNIDDMAKILGWSPDSLKDLVLNGTNEDYLGNVLYPEFNSVKDYIDTQDETLKDYVDEQDQEIKDVIQPPAQWADPGITIYDGFGSGAAQTIWDKMNELYLDFLDRISLLEIGINSVMTYQLNMSFSNAGWVVYSQGSSAGMNWAFVDNTGRFAIAHGKIPPEIIPYIDKGRMTSITGFPYLGGALYTPSLVSGIAADIIGSASGDKGYSYGGSLTFQGHTMGDDPAWADGSGDHVWTLLNVGKSNAIITIPYNTRLDNMNFAAGQQILLGPGEYMSSIDSFARAQNPPINGHGNIFWSALLPIKLAIEQTELSMSLSSSVLTFDNVIKGYSNSQVINLVVTNTSSKAINNVQASTNEPFLIESYPGAMILNPGQSVTYQIALNTGNNPGLYEQGISITGRGGVAYYVTAKVEVLEAIQINNNNIDFATIGQPGAIEIVANNNSVLNFNITSIQFEGEDNSPISSPSNITLSGDNTASSIPAGGEITLTLDAGAPVDSDIKNVILSINGTLDGYDKEEKHIIIISYS